MAGIRRKQRGMQASEWLPPSEMLQIAQERTLDIVGVWCERLRWGTATVQHLAESCYMQGVNDSIDAITRTDALNRLQQVDKLEQRNPPS